MTGKNMRNVTICKEQNIFSDQWNFNNFRNLWKSVGEGKLQSADFCDNSDENLQQPE